MKVVFTQNCTMSVGNMTVMKFKEGDEYDLDGTALSNALADGRCVAAKQKVEKPAPEENKAVEPAVENKASIFKKIIKKGK